METIAIFTEASIQRLGFRFLPSIVRAFIPKNTIGVYALFAKSKPIYIGRSDTSLQQRLASHPLVGTASHFMWQTCKTVEQAFYFESAWYHVLCGNHNIINVIHPATPANSQKKLPFLHEKRQPRTICGPASSRHKKTRKVCLRW